MEGKETIILILVQTPTLRPLQTLLSPTDDPEGNDLRLTWGKIVSKRSGLRERKR